MAFLCCRKEWDAIYEGHTEEVDMGHDRLILRFVKKEKKSAGRETFDVEGFPQDVMTKCKEAELNFEEILAIILYTGALRILTLDQSSSLLMCRDVCRKLLHIKIQQMHESLYCSCTQKISSLVLILCHCML